MSGTPETTLKKEITDLLKHIQKSGTNESPSMIASVVRIQSGATRSGSHYITLAPSGTPDLLIIMRNGIHLWLEIKTEKGKLSDSQKVWFRDCARIFSGPGEPLWAFVVRSVDDVSEALGYAAWGLDPADAQNLFHKKNGYVEQFALKGEKR